MVAWSRYRVCDPPLRRHWVDQYVYAYGSVGIGDGGFDSLVLPHVNGDCMALFLAEIAARYPN